MEYGIGELLPLVRELSERYTGKAGTSVTYETAQQLMGAAGAYFPVLWLRLYQPGGL